MGKHVIISCAACRKSVLCPIAWNGKVAAIPGWVYQERDGGDLVFCSAECQTKGKAEPVRPPAPEAHIDWERGSKPSPDRTRGRMDALTGFDCLGAHPEYVKGHGEGMAMRDILFAAVETMGQA